MNTFAEIQETLATIWKELPALLGSQFEEFETRLLPLLRQIEAAPTNAEQLEKLLAMLEEFPAVYERMLETESARPALRYRAAAGAVRATHGRYMIVPVWFATDRHAVDAAAPGERFSGDRGALTFGRLEVSIPDRHEKGSLEKPRWFRLEFREDPERHVVLLMVEPQDGAAWKAELRARLAGCTQRDLLMFIPGYNVSFEEAARRAAQFAYDLEFPGLVLLYSWPSEGRTLRYTVDEDNALWTVDHFEEVLRIALAEAGAAHVHAVAHSMGNRVLTEGLRRFDFASLPTDVAKLRQVVFAAPDINAETFGNFVKRFYARAERFTLYASSGDKALVTSQGLHKYPRAGDAGEGIVIINPGLDTVDASAVDTSLLGHSYYGDNRSIIADLSGLLREGKAPEERFGMSRFESPRGSYWAFVP